MKALADCKLYTFLDTAYLSERNASDVARQLCEGGSDLIQLRAKGLPIKPVREMALEILPILRRAGVGLVLNDYPELAKAQQACDLVRAESLLQDAFATDVRPAIQDWRDSKGLPKDPMTTFRQSGYLEQITKQRAARNSQNVSSYA